jgi:hypothetical protein
VFLAAVAFGGVAFLPFFIETDVPMRSELETEYGSTDLKTENKKPTVDSDIEKNNE